MSPPPNDAFLDDLSARNYVGTAASAEIDIFNAQSKLSRLDKLKELSWSDVQELATVGVGGFSRVYKISYQDQYYALKCLNQETLERRKLFATGAMDLALEGEILARLSHPNIIQLQGVTAGGPLQAYMESERGYFLLLDLLEDTLQSKFETHRHMKTRRGIKTKRFSPVASAKERIHTVAMGVAQGLEYMHSLGVVLRDLKPDNVGFDSSGVPKLFDFGFAREVHTVHEKEAAGSLRYMAPEVALGKGTTVKSDVYSFGVLLWEILTGNKPYKGFSSRPEFLDQVMNGNHRPPLHGIPSLALKRLIKDCWDPNPSNRPDMANVVKCLKLESSLSSSTGDRTDKAASILRGRTPTKEAVEDDPALMASYEPKNKLLSFGNDPSGGMRRVNDSFGITSKSKAGLSRMNSWTAAKRLSSSSLGLLKSLSRSNLGSSSIKSQNNSRHKANETFNLAGQAHQARHAPAPSLVNMILGKKHKSLVPEDPPATKYNMFLGPEALTKLSTDTPKSFLVPKAPFNMFLGSEELTKLSFQDKTTKLKKLPPHYHVPSASDPELDLFEDKKKQDAASQGKNATWALETTLSLEPMAQQEKNVPMLHSNQATDEDAEVAAA